MRNSGGCNAALVGREVASLRAGAGMPRTRKRRRMRLLRLGCLAVLVQLITTRPLPHYLGPEIPQRLELLLRNQEARSYVPIKKTAR